MINETIKLDFQVENPITFFDIETTGLDLEQDRIIQISAIKYFPDGSTKSLKQNFNPEGRAISKEAQEIHGLSAELLEKEPLFRDKANIIYEEFFKDSDLAGYNILNFDIPLILEEFKRIGIEFYQNKNQEI